MPGPKADINLDEPEVNLDPDDTPSNPSEASAEPGDKASDLASTNTAVAQNSSSLIGLADQQPSIVADHPDFWVVNK
ncbi:MAG: hypothetical protein ACI9RY_001575, partial [Reinekea sp.]